MGCYIEPFAFEVVDSKKHIIDVIIEPSYDNAVGFQVHEMMDGFYLYWNEADMNKLFKLLGSSFPKDSKITLKDALENEQFKARVKKVFEPQCIKLADVELEIINNVVDSELKDYVDKNQGLDGHSYRIIIYGDEIIERKTWCVLPKEWEILQPMIDLFIEYYNPVKRYHYENRVY